MKANKVKQTLTLILTFALIVSLLVISFYFWQFKGAISQSQEVWGQFGDFVGGSLNPILSLMGLIALLLTIVLQNEELQASREELTESRKQLKRTAAANETQLKFISAQQQRDDLFRLINKLVDRINNNYNGNHLSGNLSLHQAMMGEPDVNKNGHLMKVYERADDRNTRTHKIMKFIEKDLESLKQMLEEYEQVSINTAGKTPLMKFYKSEYRDFIEVMCKYSIFKKNLAEFYCDWKP